MLYTQVRWSSWYIVHLDHSIFTVSRWLTQNAHALHQISTTSLSSTKPFVNTHRPGSTAASFFITAACLGFGSSFDPHWHERLDSLIRKHLLAVWLPVMALHEANQARQEVLTIRNDIADPSCICLWQTTFCTCSISTRQHRRSVHTVISQCNVQCSDFLPKYRPVPSKQLSRHGNKERRVHI